MFSKCSANKTANSRTDSSVLATISEFPGTCPHLFHSLPRTPFCITSGLPTNSSFSKRLPLPARVHLPRAAAEGTEFQLSAAARHPPPPSIALSYPAHSSHPSPPHHSHLPHPRHLSQS